MTTEKQLIDVNSKELIDKISTLIEQRRAVAGEYTGSMNSFGDWYATHLIENGVALPVRCKECVDMQLCGISQILGENGYCSKGRRA